MHSVSVVGASVTPAANEAQIERPAIWRSFAWLMIVAACLIVVAVLRLLRAPHY